MRTNHRFGALSLGATAVLCWAGIGLWNGTADSPSDRSPGRTVNSLEVALRGLSAADGARWRAPAANAWADAHVLRSALATPRPTLVGGSGVAASGSMAIPVEVSVLGLAAPRSARRAVAEGPLALGLGLMALGFGSRRHRARP